MTEPSPAGPPDGDEPRYTSVDLRWMFAAGALVAGFVGPALWSVGGPLGITLLAIFGVACATLVVMALVYVFKRDD